MGVSMGVITQPFVAQAAVLVNRMSHDDKVRLVDEIAARVRAQGNRPSVLIREIALSYPFNYQRNAPLE